MINYDDFSKIELRVAKVIKAERVEGSDKLLKLDLDLGELGPRQILSGIGRAYEPDYLVGRDIIIVANLEPRKMMGLESHGMMLAARDKEDNPVFIIPEKEAFPGSKIN